MNEVNDLKPVIKWVGGKRQLLPTLKKYMPDNYHTYYEPFVGGGALLFECAPNQAVINDINKELISMYQVIKNKPQKLIELLRIHARKNSKNYYLEIRALDRSSDFVNLGAVEKAARLIYMLKVDFNGMYRVNKKGQFNVPYGRYKNPKIADDTTINHVSQYFNSADIKFCSVDFEKVVSKAEANDFVYFDPPYIPINATSSFTSYTDLGFDSKDQKRLKDTFFKLKKRGVKVMLSNSDTTITRDLYRGANIHTAQAHRFINSNASKRGKINELIITSY